MSKGHRAKAGFLHVEDTVLHLSPVYCSWGMNGGSKAWAQFAVQTFTFLLVLFSVFVSEPRWTQRDGSKCCARRIEFSPNKAQTNRAKRCLQPAGSAGPSCQTSGESSSCSVAVTSWPRSRRLTLTAHNVPGPECSANHHELPLTLERKYFYGLQAPVNKFKAA